MPNHPLALLAFTVVVAFLPSRLAAAPEAARPNVIVILADDLGRNPPLPFDSTAALKSGDNALVVRARDASGGTQGHRRLGAAITC